MARFVEGAEQPLAQVVLLDTVRDAPGAQRELGAERVMRLVLTSALEVIAEAPDHLDTECQLSRFREMLVEACIPGDGLSRDRLGERYELSPQFCEERPHGRGLHSVVGIV